MFEVDPIFKKYELSSADMDSVPPTWVVQRIFVDVEEVNSVMYNIFNYLSMMHV